jgi:hypothetical protein
VNPYRQLAPMPEDPQPSPWVVWVDAFFPGLFMVLSITCLYLVAFALLGSW